MRRFAFPAAIAAAFLFAGCGPKAITVGSRPFPAEEPVFIDASGAELSGLPGAAEPLRLVLLDFPWCPACGDAWTSVEEARRTFPPAAVRVYRIRFDREVLLTPEGKRQVAPLQPTPAAPAGHEAAADRDVVTLTALPGAFGKAYRVGQAPILLLIGRDGVVIRRWVGFSQGLAGELSEEVRRRSPPV